VSAQPLAIEAAGLVEKEISGIAPAVDQIADSFALRHTPCALRQYL
jgi:hypothetical protein